MSPAVGEITARAMAAFQAGQLDDAERGFREALRLDPKEFGALNLLAIILMQRGRFAEAEDSLQSALRINSNVDATLSNYGFVLRALKRLAEAVEQFGKALAINPKNPLTWNNRGTALNDLRRHAEAIADFDSAIALQPDFVDAICNKGNSLAQLDRHEEALAAYEQALALRPDFADAWFGRGNACRMLRRYDEAFSSFDKARAINPGLADAWLGRGDVLRDLDRNEEALAAYERALAINANLAEAWLGRGNVFVEFKHYDDALAAYDRALAIKPDLAAAWLGRGNVAFECKRYDDARAAYDKALEIKDNLSEAWAGRGKLALEYKRYDEAFAAFDRAFVLKPEQLYAEGFRLFAKMHLCDWRDFDADFRHLVSSLDRDIVATPPFPFLAMPSTAQEQLRCATLFCKKTAPAADAPVWRGERYDHDRIRIAYLSADFHQHATAYLMAGLFEAHDRSRFDITALSFGPQTGDDMQRRLKAAFDRFIDVCDRSDRGVAELMRELEIDIALDLKGFTQDARTGIFANRAAPLQVSYLGYPGTMGAGYIDYLITDPVLVPASARVHYSEKIVSLPDSYQINDRKRTQGGATPDRAAAGLPATGFVFCCFNSNYKITPDAFESWMRILGQVDGSVLWLLEFNSSAASNLRKAARARGVDPARLIFAKPAPLPDHLARHRLADLFLDTRPYNAHTTASDALWAGLPVLTMFGETFAGRVAASLLSAIGLPELIAVTPQAYEQMAIDLATDPDKLARIRSKLAGNRLTAPLFDTGRFARNIEAAYTAMYERHRAGLPPDHIDVAGTGGA